jgi:hypothetical protein
MKRYILTLLLAASCFAAADARATTPGHNCELKDQK